MARQRTVASRHARRPPAAAGGAAPIGRDDVLGRLRQAVDGAMAGRGLAVLLTGEAGIGKTTLWSAATEQARDIGYCVLPARAGQAESAMEYAAVADLLGDVETAARELSDAEDPAARDRLTQALQQLSADLLAHLQYEEDHISDTLRTWSDWPYR